MSETLVDFFRDAVRRGAERAAFRFEGHSVTYAELGERARAVARGLVGAGVAPGTRVGLLMANRPEWAIAAFGVWLAGGVLVPVSTFATQAERDHILAHSGVALLLMQHALRRHAYLDELLAAHPEITSGAHGRLRVRALPALRRVIAFGVDAPRGGVEAWSALAAHGADVPPELVEALGAATHPADDAVIVYTSGTMREPKGVLHAHRAPVVQARHFARSMQLSPADRVWTTQPLFWVAGMAVSLGAALEAGATLIVDEVFDPAVALERIESERATVVRAWPHQERAMAEHPDAARRDLSSIRKVNFSSPLARLAGLDADRWGTQGGYGLTETFTVVTDLDATSPAEQRVKTSGKPLPGVDLRIVDPDTGKALGPGVEGEIILRSPTMMRGYLHKRPEEAFDRDGFFHTGDGGYIDRDGYLHWTCRLSAMIKTGGANVAPAEVEAVAARHPGVRVAVALGVPHAERGQDVALCVVPDDGASVDEAALLAALRETLAAYKVPRHVIVLADDELPRTGTAKVRLGVLSDLVLARLGALKTRPG
jgi:fatty-acyl-CoA synthase